MATTLVGGWSMDRIWRVPAIYLRLLCVLFVVLLAPDVPSPFGRHLAEPSLATYNYDVGINAREGAEPRPVIRDGSGGVWVPARSTVSDSGKLIATRAGTSIVRYNADFAIGQLTRGGTARASELVDFATTQGWKNVSSATGPLKFVDENGILRLTIKSGSPRAPGSAFPHVEIRNAAGYRIDPFGNLVTRTSPGNHTPIWWDL